MKRIVLALLAVVACREPAAPASDLAGYLRGVVASDPAARTRELARWRFDRATWDATVVEPYRALHDEHDRALVAALPQLVERLAAPAAITTRAHFAGDPRMTRAQAVARWALPTLYASRIAELDGAALDVVFVHEGGRWRAITSLDALVRARIAALDPTCATVIDRIGSTGRCIEAAWAIAETALRNDRDRLAHACGLATNLCGKRSP